MIVETASNKTRFYLDSSAFMNGADYPPAECRTTPSVLAEFQPGGRLRARVERYLAAGLAAEPPRPEAHQRVREVARDAGSLSRLSPADLDLLAAALGATDAVIVTDDYTVQDVAQRLRIPTRPVQTPGIEALREWAARCGGCGRTFPPERAGEDCPVCGREIRLRVKRATGSKRQDR